MTGHWTDDYFGPLYLESVDDLLGPALSALEAGRIAALLALGPRDRLLDLACGHGRHLRPLAARAGRVVGLDRSGPYLRRAAAQPGDPARPVARVPLVRGDQRALPFRDGVFDALLSWYSSLFVFDDATNAACLAEAARVVRPGGRLLVHHANPLHLARDPVAEAARTLPSGARVEERSVWDSTQGVDRCHRRLVRPDGTVLAATAHLRYYMPAEWQPLAARAGLRLAGLTSTTGGVPSAPSRREPGPEEPDLIALLEKPT